MERLLLGSRRPCPKAFSSRRSRAARCSRRVSASLGSMRRSPRFRAAIEGEQDAVALEATLACLLWETLVQTSWCGFYRRIDARTLAVGPYQGNDGLPEDPISRAACAVRVLAPARSSSSPTSRSSPVTSRAMTERGPSSSCRSGARALARARCSRCSTSTRPHLDAFSRGEANRLEALLGEAFDGVTF